MKRAEVWTAALPAAAGREQSGQRPCLIIQDASYGQASPLVLVVPLTSQLGALRFPATVQIEAKSSSGLSQTSIALVFQVRAVDRSFFIRKLGVVTSKELDTVLIELGKLTGQQKEI